MARSVRDNRLENRTAREKLKPSGKPYYCSIGDRLHLGYRKGKGGGKWVMRRYLADVKDYVVETFSVSDDFDDADGVEVLTFHQAQAVARERVKALNEEARIAAIGPAITVRDAVEEYAAERDERETRYGGRRDRNASARLTKHVLDADEALSAKPLAILTADDDLARWREGLKMAPATVQRTVNDFKASLNRAARRYKAQLPPTIRDTIRDGLASAHAAPAVAREAQILPDADVRAIISAAWEVDTEGEWDGDLARVVLVLAATGARFSQVIRMTVADVQTAQKRLMVPVSRKGRGVKNLSHIGVRVGDDVLAALTKATIGRKGNEPLFLRPRWRKATVGRWEKRERGPWSSNHELGRLWPAIVARAGLSAMTVPYALRHSSIVRGLRAGLPVRLVAALHDTSSSMIEAHYSAHVVDSMDELAATVTPIERARR